jgi:hypothetical protein
MNLLRDSKLASPPVSELEHNKVPEWRSGAGDRSRVLARAFEDQSPPPCSGTAVAIAASSGLPSLTGHKR